LRISSKLRRFFSPGTVHSYMQGEEEEEGEERLYVLSKTHAVTAKEAG